MDVLELEARFPKLGQWERQEIEPTLRQLEDYARATHAPIGYFFLSAPPDEPLPIPDFRTLADRKGVRASPDLLDTIYVCQERQSWYREYAQVAGQPKVPLVGIATTETLPRDAAAGIREELGFDVDERRDCPTWTEALRRFIDLTDQAGVLVMVSGVVLNSNRRKLDLREFRGFVLADDLAPLVFINGADSKAAQMFTLAHELAHICLRATALSDSTPASVSPSTEGNAVELWCNRVAAELLVPIDVFKDEIVAGEPLRQSLDRHARRFKVSTLVVLRRLLDAGQLTRSEFFAAYAAEVARLGEMVRSSGGDFYRTTIARVSRRFARALVESTLEGRTLYRDAFRMLGISKSATFNEFGRSLNLGL